MSVIIVLIIISLTIASGFLIAFFWAVRSNQYEDTHTPAMRILNDDGVDLPKTEQSIKANIKIDSQ